jgi:PIN domain nuclease of toxin-antitoxin system
MESLALKACLDTHAVLWALADDPRLGGRARELIATSNRVELLIPDIALLEVAYLYQKGRITDDGGLDALLGKISESFSAVPITPEIACLAVSLDLPQGDPFDRVMVATALFHGIPLLTRDRAITASGAVTCVW